MNKVIVVSFSGGKDSTACLLKALEQKEFPVEVVYQDTGFEHKALYAYLDYVEKALGITVKRLRSEVYEDVPDYCHKENSLPGFANRGCTGELKIKPMRKFLLSLLAEGTNPEVWLGVRAKESRKRGEKYGGLSPEDLCPIAFMGGYYRVRALDNVMVRFPVVDWSEEEVFRKIEESGIRRNPLYDSGYKRVGCFPCVMSGKKTFRKVYQDPQGRENISRLIEAEAEVSRKKGKTVTFYRGASLGEIVQEPPSPEDQDDEDIECGWCHA